MTEGTFVGDPAGCERLLGRLYRIHGKEPVQQFVEKLEPVVVYLPTEATVESEMEREPLFSEILRIVCGYYCVRQIDVKSARRSMQLMRPRQVACWMAKQYTGMSLPQIGKHLGNRDHTTILHAVRKIDLLRETDERLMDDLSILNLRVREAVAARDAA